MRNFKLIVPSDCIGSNTAEVNEIFFFKENNFLFSKENDACLEQMEKLLKADTRRSADIIKDIEKMPKNRKTDAERAAKQKKVIKK
jgi:hypothetical protein